MSRRRQRRGRAYQPLPPRRSRWAARLIIVAVALFLLLGTLAVALGQQ